MEELKINSKETKDFFIHAFNEETLVPILGAGFTRGVNTGRGGKVPSGNNGYLCLFTGSRSSMFS